MTGCICRQLVVSGDCSVCQFFENSLNSEENLEVPSELTGSCRCNCIVEVNDCGDKCFRAGSRQCAGVNDKPGMTALHIACRRAGLPVIQFLLERGAAVNAVTVNDSLTPLQVSKSIQLTLHFVLYMGVKPNHCSHL